MKFSDLKFRVWDENKKQMYYFNIVDLDSGFIIGGNCDIGYSIDSNENIMQYTGLKDMNNKDIYERDVLEDGKKYNVIIEYAIYEDDEQYSTFYHLGWYGNYIKYDCKVSLPDISRVGTIRGNIYENPELLENKK